MQQNIYFRKEVWFLFKDEANKSELINQLLTNHYANQTINHVKKDLTIIKTPAQAKEAVKTIPKDDNWSGPIWKKGR